MWVGKEVISFGFVEFEVLVGYRGVLLVGCNVVL